MGFYFYLFKKFITMGGGESHNLSTQVRWSGRFEQNGGWNEMHFNHMIVDHSGTISGNGSDTVGQFHLDGHMAMNGQTTINKHYPTHTVHYRGTMDAHGWIRGNWDIPGNCNGQFELKVDQPWWSGWFEQNGQQNPIEFGLSVNGNLVTGSGADGVGCFSVHGNYNQGNGHMNFTKYYYGAHTVQYTGQHHQAHGGATIDGHWSIPGQQQEKFHLKMHH